MISLLIPNQLYFLDDGDCMKKTSGIIIKGIGGFYYVKTQDGIYECKARGLFRKLGITPVAGDIVDIIIQPEDDTAMLESIHERKNVLVRPPVANLDCMYIVVSACDPAPNIFSIDKLIAIAESKSIEPKLIFTKTDLKDVSDICNIYKCSGFETFVTSSVTRQGIDIIMNSLEGRISAFTGNSGVGKSSLLNCINPSLGLQTADISKKLGRGRHTTRKVELYPLKNGGYIADTPGFSSLDMEKCELIRKEDLQYGFREFDDYIGKCRFASCCHIKEKDCAIIEAVENGTIQQSRYESYCEMYNAVKDIKDWQLDKDNKIIK